MKFNTGTNDKRPLRMVVKPCTTLYLYTVSEKRFHFGHSKYYHWFSTIHIHRNLSFHFISLLEVPFYYIVLEVLKLSGKIKTQV